MFSTETVQTIFWVSHLQAGAYIDEELERQERSLRYFEKTYPYKGRSLSVDCAMTAPARCEIDPEYSYR